MKEVLLLKPASSVLQCLVLRQNCYGGLCKMSIIAVPVVALFFSHPFALHMQLASGFVLFVFLNVLWECSTLWQCKPVLYHSHTEWCSNCSTCQLGKKELGIAIPTAPISGVLVTRWPMKFSTAFLFPCWQVKQSLHVSVSLMEVIRHQFALSLQSFSTPTDH